MNAFPPAHAANKCAIIYAAGSQLTPEHQCIAQTPFPIWVRVQTMQGSLLDIMGLGVPDYAQGETVLNEIDAGCLEPYDPTNMERYGVSLMLLQGGKNDRALCGLCNGTKEVSGGSLTFDMKQPCPECQPQDGAA